MSEFRAYQPGGIAVARAVGWVTFLEVLRDRVLYNILFFALLVFGLGYLASQMSYGFPERILVDIGMAGIALCSGMIAILTGASLLAREFDRRTIYVALSHPISRAHFVLGKFWGLALVLALNWFLLSAVFLGVTGAVGGAETVMNPTLFLGLFFVLLQSLVLGALAILFSTFSTTSLSVMVTFGLYLIGTNISELRLLAMKFGGAESRGLANAMISLIPNFEYFNLGTKLSYGIPVPALFAAGSFAYGLTLILFSLLLAGILVRGREV